VTDHSDFDPARPPICGRIGDHPVLDLNGVPEEHWVETLSRFHPSTHGLTLARFEPQDQGAVRRAMAASGRAQLNYDRDKRVVPPEAWAHPRPLPTPEPPSAAARRGRRQVNFRLGREQHGELVRAAELMGLSATRLATLLVVRGVDQILREAKARA
jgi:hypothetical protein